MSAITRLDAQEWVNRLKATRRARHNRHKGREVEPGDEDVPVLSAATIADTVHICPFPGRGGRI